MKLPANWMEYAILAALFIATALLIMPYLKEATPQPRGFTFYATIPKAAFAIPPALKRTGEQDIVLRVAKQDAERVRREMEGRRLEVLRVGVE